jgi:hypothetical protein
MKSFILTSAAVAFALVLGSTSNLEASPHHSSGHVVAHGHVAVGYHHNLYVHGRSVDVRVYHRGYNGWSSRCWLPGYRTYGYYCGSDNLWYYWYAPLNEYLPITYLSAYPPTPVAVPVGIPVTSVALPMSSALPPGATLIPGPITAP